MKVIVRATRDHFHIMTGSLVIKRGTSGETDVKNGLVDTGFGTCPIDDGWEVFEGTNQLAGEWWNSFTFEEKFYKTIEANSVIKGDKTRHPMDLSENEIMLMYKFHKQK